MAYKRKKVFGANMFTAAIVGAAIFIGTKFSDEIKQQLSNVPVLKDYL
ncbi:hypothetical protein [Zunongwangia profunda]|uniref:Uncharacterized protein n=1 Tax=Zunongwangia profunda (strain DSM 18752 / CCTCC AB 206139 / SM-A87) TaxID=655815 RepID=D5BF93_ZUNPS|nr:hypothetical protein [Zunongwangia profunda]ADF52991.1 hypothetical protein ZPR_2669 [Zunongwangia profunda SM-A87]|tara:strand:- start:4028 stop:4171 length:144 start_codon:yes stop_codon:yes gene_type:complete